MSNTREITENGRYNVRLDNDIQVNVPTKEEDIRALQEQIATTRERGSGYKDNGIYVSDGQVEIKSTNPLGWNVLKIEPEMMAADMVVVDGKVQVDDDYYVVSGLTERQEQETIVVQTSPLVVNNIPVFATPTKRVKWEWNNGGVWGHEHEETWIVEGKIGDTIRLLWDRDFHNVAPYLELYADEELLVRDQYEPYEHRNEGVMDYTMQSDTVVIKAVYGHRYHTTQAYTDNISLSIIHYAQQKYETWVSDNQGKDYTTSSHTWVRVCKTGDIIPIIWSVDSEQNCDWLTIYVNDEQVVRESGEDVSGTYKYTTTDDMTVTIRAEYSKDGSVESGTDTARVSVPLIDNVEYYPLLLPNEGQGLSYGYEPINVFGPHKWNSGSKTLWSYEINPREYSWDILYRKQVRDYFSDEWRQNTIFIQDGFNIPLYDIVLGEEHYEGYIKAEPNQNFYDGQFEIGLNNPHWTDYKCILRWGGNEHWTDSTGREWRYYFIAVEYINGQQFSRPWESNDSGRTYTLNNLRIGNLSVTFYYDGTSRGIVGFSVHFDFDLHTDIGYTWNPAVMTIHPFDVSQYFNQDAIQNASVFIFNEDNIKTI